MSFWKKSKQIAITNRLAEEKEYEQVFHEIETGLLKGGLWAKALQKSSGNEREAKALYIKYRLQSIRDERDILKAITPPKDCIMQPPKSLLYSFKYKGQAVYHDNNTYWTDNIFFHSPEEAKSFIDNNVAI